ncbi:MAG TPA: discoidin domain-containing protein, partial [Rhodothermales bacterium]|nr:discoidin domain-containing protein [Rhodothermales bacterium]
MSTPSSSSPTDCRTFTAGTLDFTDAGHDPAGVMMKKPFALRCLPPLIGLLMLSVFTAQAQPDDRIRFNDQDLWLSGGNIAWINFARDIGPGPTDLTRFDEIFQQLHDNGGNAMRIWLHTTGAATPAWDGSTVTGPGTGAIEDLRAILDLAWEHEIGLMLCLWSFDMLRISNGTTITDRAYDLLTDPVLTQTYIDNALIPMVEALGDHPAVIAWEIFNEPEGMSNEHGWNFNRHVPMSAIQRFINLTAGAIHRTHPDAQVTNGSWAFIASSDQSPSEAAAKTADTLTNAEVQTIRQHLSQKYRHNFSIEETAAFYDRLHSAVNYNYYRDDRLLNAGGDPDGTLDFYTVHYYEWAGTALSPFHHDKAVWGLTKPLVIAEFFMGDGDDGNPSAVYGVHWQSLYETLYEGGYAGGLAWQWFNYPNSAEGVVNWPRILDSTQEMFDLYPAAVDVYPGLRIAYLRADPTGIEAGQSSDLSWSVTGATTITINGAAVDSVGTMTVAPTETTTYTLEVVGRDTGEMLTEEVTITVLDPDQVNRARTQPAVASTIETCCGDPLPADLAFDGNPNTRWSSEWQEDLADDDPDDEWIYVDLGLVLDVERIVLAWEAAYGEAYNLDVSFDGRIWTTIHEQRSGNGGTEEITFTDPPAGRFVRMQGLERGSEYGYSLWEMEVYGTASALQPPTVAFSS